MKQLLIIMSIMINSIYSIKYNKNESLEYLYLQRASYCPKQNIELWELGDISDYNKQMTDIKVNYNQMADGLSYIGYNNEKIIIAFRGTVFYSLTNWFYNFQFMKTVYGKCENCEVHSGFFALYNQLKKQMIQDLKIMIQKYPYSPIVITGHSLGGALSILAAVDIQQLLQEQSYTNFIKEVHTFGSPRVGNQEFADFYNLLIPQTIRVIQNKDTIPHLPPAVLGYTHVGTEVWFDESQESFQTCNQNEIDNEQCSGQILMFSYSDHLSYLNTYTGCGILINKPNIDICLNETRYFINKNTMYSIENEIINSLKIMLFKNK